MLPLKSNRPSVQIFLTLTAHNGNILWGVMGEVFVPSKKEV